MTNEELAELKRWLGPQPGFTFSESPAMHYLRNVIEDLEAEHAKTLDLGYQIIALQNDGQALRNINAGLLDIINAYGEDEGYTPPRVAETFDKLLKWSPGDKCWVLAEPR